MINLRSMTIQSFSWIYSVMNVKQITMMDAGQVPLVIYSFIMINLLVLARLTTELFFLVKFRNHFG